jgi:hypothetical protein
MYKKQETNLSLAAKITINLSLISTTLATFCFASVADITTEESKV